MKEQDMSYTSLTDEHTPDWLRTFEGCSHYTDKEAIEVLNSLDVLAAILLPIAQRICSRKPAAVIHISENNLNPIKKAA